MSHVVTIMTEVRDAEALRVTCQRLGLDTPVWKRAKLFREEVEGYCVSLPDWLYPVVCDTSAGEVKYDNFGGRWGEQAQLDSLVQRYAVEKATIEARRQGHSVVEQSLDDGSIKLTVEVGEDA